MIKLGPNDLKEQHFANRVWKLILAPELTLADIERPDVWANVAGKMTRHDELHIWADDGSWYCQAVVRAVSRLEAVVAILPGTIAKFGPKALSEIPRTDFAVEFKGEKEMWSIYRLRPGKEGPVKAGGGPIKAGFATREQADAWVKDHVKALAA